MRINGNKPLLSTGQLQGLINHLFMLFVLQSLHLAVVFLTKYLYFFDI